MDKLKKARIDAGLTQADLANRLGVAVITVKKWEAGDRAPTIERLREIAKALGVKPGALL